MVAFIILFGSFAPALRAQPVQATANTFIGCNNCENKPIRRATQPYTKKSPKTSVDWTTMASTYSHDPQGQRVDQFSTGTEPVVIERPDFVKSGYRHTRSTLQAGASADHYHSVEQWGPTVRPYGEWRYPTRPFSVPYGAWGPQLPQVLSQTQAALGFPWGGPHNGHMPLMPGMPGSIPNALPGSNGGSGWNGNPWNGNVPYGNHGLGVGPGNALTPLLDDYYAPAPIYNPPTHGLE